MKKVNLMEVEGKVCPHLISAYEWSIARKTKFLEMYYSRKFLDMLPDKIADALKSDFLSGNKISDGLVDYFIGNSEIIPLLRKNPGTFLMLEMMYFFEEVLFPLDIFFKESIAGGQALSGRFAAVNDASLGVIRQIVSREGKCLVLDLGSGPGRNGMVVSLYDPAVAEKTHYVCNDIDSVAIHKGNELWEQFGLSNYEFLDKSMVGLHKHFPGTVDFGLKIGVLCAMFEEEKIGLLKRVRPYFKEGGLLLAASLTERMLLDDFFCAWLLNELVPNWGLKFPYFGHMEEVVKKTGCWKIVFNVSEKTGLYEMPVLEAI